MILFQATGDLRKVSLWLGHANMQTTEVYLRADPSEKLEAIESVVPPSLRRGQFSVPDRLIAILRGLS
jgi:integrase/recombinase XerD